METDDDGVGWGKFLRVKIRVDLTKLLARGRRLNIEGRPVWTHFQYERIPRFCFHCEVVLHGTKGCMKREEAMTKERELEYGPWLRAPLSGRRLRAGQDRKLGREYDAGWASMTRGY